MFTWEWWDGKKTAVGAALLLASMIGSQAVIGIWEYTPWWMPKVILTLDLFGGLLTSGGLIHRAAKAKNGG